MTITTSKADGAPETERTASDGRQCMFCGAALRSARRDARYCSDRCRTSGGRTAHRQRLVAQLDAIAFAVTNIRHELKLEAGDGDVANEHRDKARVARKRTREQSAD